MKIRRPYDDNFEIKATACGSPIIKQYEFDEETGVLEEVGEFDLQAYIDSFESDTDISKLVEKYKAGDLQALNRVQKIYGDVTELPSHLGEALELTKAVNFAQIAMKARQATNMAQNALNNATAENSASEKGENN